MYAANEQWKHDGVCGMCRKNSYCKKPCTANKKRRERLMHEAVGEVIKEFWFGKKVGERGYDRQR